ncbi:MAG: DUF4351 domain-containing protein, partial [Gloeotrichia echinulata HAB0833]
VIYQDILQKGLQQGLQQGAQQGEVAVILRLLTRRLGAIAPETEQQIRALAIAQLEDLAEALLDFTSQGDVINYLGNIS